MKLHKLISTYPLFLYVKALKYAISHILLQKTFYIPDRFLESWRLSFKFIRICLGDLGFIRLSEYYYYSKAGFIRSAEFAEVKEIR